MQSDVKWVEVWIDYQTDYTLSLKAINDNSFVVFDAQTKETRKFDSYQEAYYWLREDEFERVAGRYHEYIEGTPYLEDLSDRAMQLREKFGEYELTVGERKWTREDIMMGFVGDVGDLAKLVMAHQNIRDIPE